MPGELHHCWGRQRFDRVSSISTAMVQRLGAKAVAPSRSLLLPNWVDLEQIRPQLGAARLHNTYRQELGIGPDQLVLLYSGSMNKKQGLDLLVDVIHQLADLPQLVWLLAGEGPTKGELVAATAGLPQVRHLPLQPSARLNDWLNAADIHLGDFQESCHSLAAIQAAWIKGSARSGSGSSVGLFIHTSAS